MNAAEESDAIAERILIDGYRSMPVERKLRQVGELSELVRKLAFHEIRTRYPHVPERHIRLRLASRWIPAELMKAAFGWNVEKEGY